MLLTKNIGNLLPGQIYVRAGTRSVFATRNEILEMAKGSVYLQYRKEINDLEQGHLDNIQEIQLEYEEKINGIEKDFKEKIERESRWATTEIEILKKDINKLGESERSLRHFAKLACNELYMAWPSSNRKRNLKKFLNWACMNDFYKDVVS
jgi:hypothetical protein